jgi:ABC-2 type transport system ATP-binding protein
VIGGGRLLAADSLEAITAGNETTVAIETPQPGELIGLLAALGLQVDAGGNRLTVRGTTKDHVSQIAFDNRVQLVEITETSRSLEDTLLEMTSASAEFASA